MMRDPDDGISRNGVVRDVTGACNWRTFALYREGCEVREEEHCPARWAYDAGDCQETRAFCNEEEAVVFFSHERSSLLLLMFLLVLIPTYSDGIVVQCADILSKDRRLNVGILSSFDGRHTTVPQRDDIIPTVQLRVTPWLSQG